MVASGVTQGVTADITEQGNPDGQCAEARRAWLSRVQVAEQPPGGDARLGVAVVDGRLRDAQSAAHADWSTEIPRPGSGVHTATAPATRLTVRAAVPSAAG